MKRAIIVLFVLLVMLSYIPSFSVATEPYKIETTVTFSALTYDMSLYDVDASYAVAHDSVEGHILALSYFAIGGQNLAGLGYEVWRSFVPFDTSTLPSDANVTSAVLGLYIDQDNSTTDFNMTIQHSINSAVPHEPVITSDYYHGYYWGNGGNRSTNDALSEDAYWNITLNVDGRSWINVTGHTFLALRSSRDINNTVPTGIEYVMISTYERGEAYSPKLYVVYESSGYKYIIHGPYLENGSVFNGIINVTLNYESEAPRAFVLNGTGGTEQNSTQNSTIRGTIMQWNITSDYNRSRSYSLPLAGTYFDEVWLYVPNIGDTALQYAVSVTDFASLTNATVEVDRNVLGYNRIVERQLLDLTNAMNFWLISYQSYTLKVVSDQGSFTWNLPADGDLTKNYWITSDMIQIADPTLNVTVSATRNGTSASVYYSDPALATSTVTSTISLHNITGYFLLYTQTDTGNVQNYTISTLTSSANYVCLVVANRSGSTYTWSFALPTASVASNRWHGVYDLFTTDATMRALLENGMGILVVVMFMAIGSWSDTEWFVGVAIVIALMLTVFGLITVPYAGGAMALMVVMFMYFHRGKQESREF